MSTIDDQPVAALGVAGLNGRGFPAVSFTDSYGKKSSVQASSIVGDYPDSLDRPGTSALWLGIDDPDPQVMASHAASFGVTTDQTVGWVPYPIPPAVLLSTRMHLNREQVAGLIDRLQEWLDTGEFS